MFIPTAQLNFQGTVVVIYDETLTVDTANFDVQNIPSSFKHLQMFLCSRSTRAAQSEDPILLRFNNDSGANYDYLTFQVLGADSGVATVSRDEGLAQDGLRPGTQPAATSPSGAHADTTIIIQNYAATTFRKGITAHCSAKLLDSTGGLRNWHAAGEWNNTSAVNRVTLLPVNATFLAGSRLTIWGLH